MTIWSLVITTIFNTLIINVNAHLFNCLYLISLFLVGKLKAACEAVASYLLFYPNDRDMKINVQYYKSLPEVSDKYFVPREVILECS